MTAVQERTGADPLVVARAVSELATRRRLAAVVAAKESGRTQRDIAAALDVTQPAVAQMLARARRWPSEWQRTARQVVLEYAAGELNRVQMRKELVSWPWTYGEFEDGPQAEGYVRGSWDQLVAAVREQLIDQDDYAYVVERAASA